VGQEANLDPLDDSQLASLSLWQRETDFLFDFPIANKAPNCPGKQKNFIFAPFAYLSASHAVFQHFSPLCCVYAT
jgi:hypothetical protein